jgi:prepilin-type N-terminal cleavage/methylation domain-containing protein
MSINTQTGRIMKMGRRAFTLIEVMIAVVITAIIFSAVHYGLLTGFMMVASAREQLRGNQICLSRMEGIRLCNWDTQLFSNSIVPTSFTDYYYPVGMGYQSNGVVYYGTMTFSNVTLSPSPSYAANMRQVTVTVTWTNIGSGAQTVHTETMQSYVAHYGVQNYVYTH